VVSLTSSSGGYINGRNSANLELLIDKTSSIYLNDLYCDDFVDYSYLIRQLLGVSTLAVNSDRLEKVQTEAARIVTGLTSYASLDSIYCETGTLQNILKYLSPDEK
jgi:hypothetical protein